VSAAGLFPGSLLNPFQAAFRSLSMPAQTPLRDIIAEHERGP
jgi:hypothetical protein